ncbi:MAG: XRE family transcriptional regulator [Chloroflexi bacterium]|nr:XRE family transcriptional regulator [Chloroflexota bacterium]
MKRSSPRDRDYIFGQAMLTLRSAMGLTQAGLANLLGVSRYALGDWETGENYPKAEHLKHFITLAVQQKALPAGHEAESIRSLWQLSRQKVLLDEHWLTALLGETLSFQTEAESVSSGASTLRRDWGDTLSVSAFYGREQEIELLNQWVFADRCQVISVLGQGGIGKTALIVSLMHQIADHFDVVIWRSLRDAPSCEVLLDGCLRVLAPQLQMHTAHNLEERLQLLLEYLRNQRALIVLDNLESILSEGEVTGQMRAGYEDYERLLHRISETEHQSCLLLTSREKPTQLVPLEGDQSTVRTLRLSRLESEPCQHLLAEKGITGTDAEHARLIEAYTGNPLALKIVAQTIVELFDGEIKPFLEEGEVIFGGVRRLLDEQAARLSRLERDVMIWLAILREPSTLDDLRAVLVRPTAKVKLLETLESLSRRSLIEQGQTRGSFTLQSVVLEYVTARVIEVASAEIERGELDRLARYGLELAHVREYVRQIETRLIAAPVLARLRETYSQQSRLETHLLTLLKRMSVQAEAEQGYAPANLVVLLRLLRGNLRGVDLSQLVLRDLDLQDVEMQDARLTNTTIQNSVFTEAFDALTAVATSSTGEYWAASGRRGELRIWEAGGQILRHMWRGHVGTTWALTFSPNGQILASGSSDGSLKLWEVASGNLLWVSRDSSDVNRLSFSPDGLVLAGAGHDSHIYLWDVASGTLLQTIPLSSPVAAVAWSPDGQFIASGDRAGYVRLWAVEPTESPRLLRTLTQHASCADGLAFSPDGRMLASASWDYTVKLWEVASGYLLQTLTGHTDRVGRVTWSPDGRILASNSADQTILLWDVEQTSYRGALIGHNDHVFQIAFTPDSRSLLSSGRDGSLRVWDVASEQCVRVTYGYAASIYVVDWSPDGSKLVSSGTDLAVTLWDADTGMPLQVLQENTEEVRGVGWSPDGRWLASSDSEYGIRLWDLTAGTDFRFLRRPDNSGNYIYDVAWSPDSHHLASGTHQHGIVIWDVLTGEEIWIGRQSSIWFLRVAWSPDGTRLAGAGSDDNIYIWHVVQDRLELQLAGHQSRINGLAWSPDGTRLASGSRGAEGGELHVWDVQSGACIHRLAAHVSAVAAVTWDANGERLITGGWHGTLRCWDAESGDCLWKRDAHNGAIQSIRRSPDGTKLASCGDDGAIMLWDINSGERLKTLRRDRPYERLNITGIKGLTEAEKNMLYTLGAIEDDAT